MSNALEKIIDLKLKLECELAGAIGEGMYYDGRKKETYEYLKKFLRINCHHKWVTDSIDLLEGYRECVQIKYCELCKLNFIK